MSQVRGGDYALREEEEEEKDKDPQKEKAPQEKQAQKEEVNLSDQGGGGREEINYRFGLFVGVRFF